MLNKSLIQVTIFHTEMRLTILYIFSVFFNIICHIGECMLNGHVTSPNLTVFNIFSRLIFVNSVSALNCLLIM